MNAYQALLSGYMSDISEEQWCAGWLIGLEYILWEWLHQGTDHLTEEEIEVLSHLAEKAGGWIMWSEEERGMVFVPMSEWLILYDKHVSEFEKKA